MSPETRQKIQLTLVVLTVIVAARTAYIFYRRHEDRIAAENKLRARDVGYSDPDDYVNPKKLYPYDLKTAKQLTQQPVWVKVGYYYVYYRYDAARRHVAFERDAGVLLPIEKLKITEVLLATPPKRGELKQVMAVFEKDGKTYAVPIGAETNQEFKIYSDEMFFVEDPHELYEHWPPDVWRAVDRHEVKPGMNELQAGFALGVGVPEPGASSYDKTVRYRNGGSPVVIAYRDGRVASITPVQAGP